MHERQVRGFRNCVSNTHFHPSKFLYVTVNCFIIPCPQYSFGQFLPLFQRRCAWPFPEHFGPSATGFQPPVCEMSFSVWFPPELLTLARSMKSVCLEFRNGCSTFWVSKILIFCCKSVHLQQFYRALLPSSLHLLWHQFWASSHRKSIQ